MTVQITYTITGLDALIAKTSNPAQLLGPPLRKGLTTSALLVEGEAKRLVPVDTGNLRRTITHKVDGSAVPLFAEVGTNATYARAVHDGRRAGAKAPPVSAIRGWASRHGIPATALFVVARAIGRKGTKGRPFLMNAFRAMHGKIDNAMATVAREIESRWAAR